MVVIGGSSGIGLETARLAREEGADVIITARDPDRLHRAGLELEASIAAFDATDSARLDRFFRALPGPSTMSWSRAAGPTTHHWQSWTSPRHDATSRRISGLLLQVAAQRRRVGSPGRAPCSSSGAPAVGGLPPVR